MILAAGRGTRLRPLTLATPKALVEVGGMPMLERVARRLVAAGADRLIVNVHPHPDRVSRFVERLGVQLGVEARVSREAEGPLETGGGLLRAAAFFRRSEPFFVHNVDVESAVDLAGLYAAHAAADPLVTLAVQRRETSRALLFDDAGLVGWDNAGHGTGARAREPVGPVERLAFAGIHVAAPRIFDLFVETGAFSIVDVWLRLASEGQRIVPHDVSDAAWLEVGTPERLERARRVAARDPLEPFGVGGAPPDPA